MDTTTTQAPVDETVEAADCGSTYAHDWHRGCSGLDQGADTSGLDA